MADKTEFEAAQVAAAISAGMARFSGTGTHQCAAMPNDWHVSDLEKFQDRPNRAKASEAFADTESLIGYVNRFADEGTCVVKSDRTACVIKAVLDYHEPKGEADWCQWTASFVARKDNRYARWSGISGQRMGQVKAGEFLEERAVDVIEPDAATVMDMVMQFDALKKVTFKQSTRLHDGNRQFQYIEETEARGALTLPERIKIRVPVFEGMEPDVIDVRVRYRIDDGSLVFIFEIHDEAEVLNTAFERCEDAVRVGISSDIPIYSVA